MFEKMFMRTRMGRALSAAQKIVSLCGLGSNRWKMEVLPLRQFYRLSCRALVLSCGIAGAACAFTQVTISTGAPLGIETQFLAATTTQFDAVIIPNPLAANTYSLKIYGPNPLYNATPQFDLSDALTFGSTVYAYGFANGQDYERHVDLGVIGNDMVQCSSPTPSFPLVNFDSANCVNFVNFASATLTGYITKCSTDQTVFGLPQGSMSSTNCMAIVKTLQNSIAALAQSCNTPSSVGFTNVAPVNCQNSLSDSYFTIYQMYFSTPTVIPVEVP